MSLWQVVGCLIATDEPVRVGKQAKKVGVMKQKTYLDKLMENEEFKEKSEKEYRKLDKPLKKKQLPKSNENWEIIPGEKLTDEFINNLVSDFYKNKNHNAKKKIINADQP